MKRDQVSFRIAKMFYENQRDLDKAMEEAEKIALEAERARCYVHLALSILKNEGDVKKADAIIEKITGDPKGYIEYYKKAKKEL